MRFEREFGLRKILENFGTLALSGTCYVGTMGLRPVTMVLTSGQRLELQLGPRKIFSYLKCMGPSWGVLV